MKKAILVFVLALTYFPGFFAQNSTDIEQALNSAAAEFKIPADLIKAVAFTESRFSHRENGPHSHSDMPLSYGVMGLRNDEWFGHSLKSGAALINQDIELAASDYRQNIRAGAAYLASLAKANPVVTENINTWKSVLETYSGIPQPEVKEFYSFDVLKVLHDGLLAGPILISSHPEVDLSVFGEKINPVNKLKNIESDDYAPAVWSPSPNFTTASLSQKFAVVHTTEGNFAGSVSWLQNPQASASSHYVIRSSDGYIVQLVREADKAWHAVCWNGYMLGVEHEAFVDNPAYFTDAMYLSSAALFRHFCIKFNIPYDRNRIIGHNEWKNTAWTTWMASNFPSIGTTCNTHTDPGQYWDWAFYMQLVSQDTTRPVFLSSLPVNNQDSVFANQKIKLTFNQRMKKTETQAAFSISPSISGVFTWENNGRTMVFSPSPAFQTSTQYTVTLAATATNYVNGALRDGYQFTFRTAAVMPLTALGSYPSQNAVNISPSVKMMMTFNTPLLQSSLTGNVELRDASNAIVPIKPVVYQENNFQGTIVVSATNTLVTGGVYTLIAKSAIKNVSGTELGSAYSITFRVTNVSQQASNILDNFDVIGNWKDPNYSGSTVGTDPNITAFDIVSEDAFEGTKSGKITYLFTDPSGVCRTFNGTKPSVGSEPAKRVGLWVNGDYSKNLLEYWFYYNTSTNVILPVDTLNWTGWKLVEVPISSITGSGDRLFHSVVIRRIAGGSASGAIYIDALQTRIPSAVNPPGDGMAKYAFQLEQNYPNPFNPSTTIRFAVETQDYVSLIVYDALGNEVKRLVGEEMHPGEYAVSFDLSTQSTTISSGVYFYTLRTGNSVHTKKMLYIR